MLLKILAFCVLVYMIFRISRAFLRAIVRIAAPQQQEKGGWSGPRPEETSRTDENVEDANYVDIQG